ncbi:DUF1778 domain-containing protein [Moraxella bovis]|uniref:type II toxin-antitoxin system TacA family antitoxin n=1 Tax=Moraxella bovis TaxID=476 RepID=UPI002227C5B9|nr:DUF1778 domain-containing protein [Moraxella bovis]UYZ67503.1 DUF1778 domain-containing protein [Moraxella bovis]UYZ69864.1 DUF1778 domain-containing protein [Moraxella bovis]UYZ74215.1 DUF1778 domain-containing protein [Moraxella bovis]UZA13147.1 DUF1778 domain-containing protein [Moraxella bovis]UZA28514.1 DUF1778 domain-containing protein [Moraxella bovis]
MIVLDITPSEQVIIEKASQIVGMSLSDFITEQAYQAALKIVDKDKGIYLTDEEWNNMMDFLNNPPELNEKMKALIARGYELDKS